MILARFEVLAGCAPLTAEIMGVPKTFVAPLTDAVDEVTEASAVESASFFLLYARALPKGVFLQLSVSSMTTPSTLGAKF